MKILVLALILPMFTGCLLLSPNTHKPRRQNPEVASDLDHLEQLLLNDQQPLSSQRVPATQRLSVGMEKQRVERKMGRPSQVEVAGNPKYGNERWTYERAVPTLDGYYTEKRVIYFEGGSVVGWESQ